DWSTGTPGAPRCRSGSPPRSRTRSSNSSTPAACSWSSGPRTGAWRGGTSARRAPPRSPPRSEGCSAPTSPAGPRPCASSTAAEVTVALVMGVLNVTPDSFSDGGEHLAPERAVERAARMIEEGAAWIDVGGESTRPGALPVDPDEARRRVRPVLYGIVPLARAAGVGVSIDTRNEATARAAVAHGAALINDVAATLWPVAAELGVGWVAMHMLGDPRTMQRSPRY